jgi:uncharacterized protein (DUF362 family)
MVNRISRREFIELAGTALGSLALLPKSGAAKHSAISNPNTEGRIVIVSSLEATTGSRVNETVVQQMVDEGVKRLTGNDDIVAAFESLFPGIDSSKKIAIKPNLLNSHTPTRKETVKAVNTRLVQMAGGTFQPDGVHIYENSWHSRSAVGYTNSYFGAGFHIVGSDYTNRGHYIFCDGRNRPYCKTLHDCDYLINMPVLKDHNCGMELTLSMKNHMGTVNPSGSLGICGNEQATLDIIASDVIRNKTKLIILDALFGVYSGGPGGRPMSWRTWPESTPNRLVFSTDPVMIDFWGRKVINAERTERGMGQKRGNYIEKAGNPPYNAGICDEASMEVVEVDLDSTSVPTTHITPERFSLFQNYPNPFNNSTEIRFQLKSPAQVEIEIFDTLGRKVTTLVNAEHPAGTYTTHWWGHGEHGWSVSSGTYMYRMRAGDFLAGKMMAFVK